MNFFYLTFFAFGATLCAEKFYVATNGNDSNPGSESAPFQSLERARDAVRSLPNSAFEDQDVYVLLRDGTYRITQPFQLSPVNSGRKVHDVVYASYPNETAVISGGVQITNWSLHDALLNIYVADAPQQKSRQLYVNETRAVRAQTTPYPVAFLPSLSGGGIQYIMTAMNPAAWRDPSLWTNPSDIEAVILTQWKMMRVPVSSISSFLGAGLLTMQEPAWTNSNVYFDKATNAPGIWAFWQVTRFENAYQFLTDPGQWYLDYHLGKLYYIPLPGQDITTADVELPLLETLVQGHGTLNNPIHNIRFEGLTFTYATWLTPSSSDGYVSDQSAQILIGTGHTPNYTGHDPNVVSTPGNLQFTYAHNIVFTGNIFEHLGAVGLQFGTGSQKNTIESNLFTDISSSAIELGGVALVDHHPTNEGYVTKHNLITNNLIRDVAAEYSDCAGIFVGFTKKTTISHNTIVNVPWSGIAMGWGWGLLDKDTFPGIANAYQGQWGTYNSLTPNSGNVIIKNRIHSFVNVLWDAGAVYTTGRQAASMDDALLIKENVASGKFPRGGSNIFYTDGGSRYIRLEKNVSYDNPIGVVFLGPPPPSGDPLPYPSLPSLGNNVPYGSDFGGCRTYGDIHYSGNYFLEAPLPQTIVLNNFINNSVLGKPPYSSEGFFDICPFVLHKVSYPTNLTYKHNHFGFSKSDIPQHLLNAGVQDRPSTIPPEKWILPPP